MQIDCETHDLAVVEAARLKRRVEELEASLQSVFAEWEPTRDDYRADRKGQRQYEQARDVWESAHRVLDGK